MVSRQWREEIKRRRLCLQKEVETLIMLLRQNLPVRGKVESDGNLQQILKLRSKDVPGLRGQDRYLSPTVQNELIKDIGLTVLRRLLSQIREAKFFSIMLDETSDSSIKEQLSVSLRWVDKDMYVHEDPVELIHVEDVTGEALLSTVKDSLVRMMLEFTNCRGQAYDGAANMQGKTKGVAARIQQEVPSAIHVHCLAHCVNLCLQDASRKSRIVRDALDLTGELTSFVRNSPKTTATLRSVINEDGASSQGSSMRPLCPTRWTCRTASVRSVLQNYIALMDTLETVCASSNDEHSRRAGGMLALMERFNAVFGLHVALTVFSVGEELSRTLQTEGLTAQQATAASDLARSSYEKMRTDSEFDKIFKAAERMVDSDPQGRIAEPVLPRRRKVPRRLTGDAEDHQDEDVAALYRRQYYETLDILVAQLKERFNQPSFAKVHAVEEVIEAAASGQEVEIPKTVRELYQDDIDMDRLRVQLRMLPDVCKQRGSNPKAADVIADVSAAIRSGNPVFAQMLKEVCTLMRLYLTLPVTTATAERTFSVLRRTKTYLRSTMTQVRLNAAMLCHVHKERADDLDASAIAKAFGKWNDRRRHYFGY